MVALILRFEGKGAIYGYDPVGCLERLPFGCCGSSEQLIDPVLDSLVIYYGLQVI